MSNYCKENVVEPSGYVNNQLVFKASKSCTYEEIRNYVMSKHSILFTGGVAVGKTHLIKKLCIDIPDDIAVFDPNDLGETEFTMMYEERPLLAAIQSPSIVDALFQFSHTYGIFFKNVLIKFDFVVLLLNCHDYVIISTSDINEILNGGFPNQR